MARKVTPQSIIASNWPPIWNHWSTSRGLSAIAELLVKIVDWWGCHIKIRETVSRISNTATIKSYSLASVVQFCFVIKGRWRGFAPKRVSWIPPSLKCGCPAQSLSAGYIRAWFTVLARTEVEYKQYVVQGRLLRWALYVCDVRRSSSAPKHGSQADCRYIAGNIDGPMAYSQW